MSDALSRLPTPVARPRAAPDTSWIASIPDAFRRPEPPRREPSPVGLIAETLIEPLEPPPRTGPMQALWRTKVPRPTDAAWHSE